MGDGRYSGAAEISVREGVMGRAPKTELNVATWYDGETSAGITLRLYRGTDFRDQLLAGETIEGAVQDLYRDPGGPAYVGENGDGGTYFGTGTYRVSFETEGRVKGSFDVEMTSFVRDAERVEYDPRQRSATFDLPYGLLCWVAESETSSSRSLDRDFSSEFCAPFKHLAEASQP